MKLARRKFSNTEKLRPAAKSYEENGYYTDALKKTQPWYEYWREQERRCMNGYSAGGISITGYHYFYLNFTRIDKYDKERGEKVEGFPDFWDGDFTYFWTAEIARNGISEEKYNQLKLGIDIERLDGGRHLVVLKGRRKGFAQPNSEEVQTPNGPVKIGKLEVGDEVLSNNGKSTEVDAVYPQGKKDVYQVELRDGRKVRCSKNHLWQVRDYKDNPRTVDTEKLYNSNLTYNTGKSNQYYHWFIELPDAIEYEEKELDIHPYLLGVFLGDGSTNNGSLKITNYDDKEIIERVKNLLPKNHYIREKDNRDYIIKSRKSKNLISRKLKKLGVWNNSLNKSIPETYLYSSKKQRLELLRGLMDADGSSRENGSCVFATSSKDLKNNLENLLASLGIRYKSSKKIDENKYNSWSKNPHWQINITTEKEIFHLERKNENIRSNRNYNFRKIPIINVKKLDSKEEQTCISVKNSNSIYLTTDYVPTHNTYKAGSMLARNYCMGRRSKNYAMASLGDYLTDDGILDKGCWNTVDFVESNTPFNQGRLTDKKSKKVSGFKHKTSSGYVEKGRKNQVIGISLKDNPEKARGKGGELGFFEEAGKFPGLVKAWQVCKPSYEQGKYTTGLMVAYGTGGTEGGDYEGLEELFYNPDTYDILPIKNIWDDGSSSNNCSFFYPAHANFEGFMDKNGNSDMESAKEHIEDRRDRMKQSDSGKSVDQYIAEFPFKPREATLRVDNNIFPTESLQRQRSSVVSENRFHAISVGILYRQPNGNVKFKPDSDRQPIWKFPTPKGIDRRGAVTIKESPKRNQEGKVPDNLYIICHDPYAHDGSPEGSSLGAAYVIKRVNNFSTKYMDCIVGSYVGRPDRQDQYNDMLFKLAEYYNAKIAFENNRGSVVQYAKNKRKLQYLARKPDIIDNKDRKASRRNTSRPYGIPMTKSMKNQGEVYIRDWLTQPVPTPEGEGQKTILNTILDPALLSELTNYNQDGNFDRVMALMVGMYFLEELEQKRVAPKKERKRDDFFQREDQFFPKH